MYEAEGRKRYFKDLSRRDYIDKAFEIINTEGAESLSIRRIAKAFGCSSTSLYHYFKNLDELIYFSYLVYLDEYLKDLNSHESEWKDIWEIHIGIWECYCRTAFRHPKAFNAIFFSETGRKLPEAIREYYAMFPERLNIVSPYLQVMLKSADLLERDMVMVQRCVDSGVLPPENASKLNHHVCFLYKGYLKDILDYGIKETEVEERVAEIKAEIEEIVGMYASDTLGHDYGHKGEAEEYFTVWTRQDPAVADVLEKGEVYTARESFIRKKNGSISDYYIGLYRWLTDKCRDIMAVPKSEVFPIWLSMHEEYRLRPVENTAVLKLNIPKKYIKVFSEYAWGYRVNYMYMPYDKKDSDEFNRELSRYNIASESSLITGNEGNYYPLLKRKIIKSWDRIFAIPPLGPEDELGICFELRPEWLAECERY